MDRPLRPTAANVVSHVLNRANVRRTLFDNDGDYAASVVNNGSCHVFLTHIVLGWP
jgi:hypothetical protein